MFSCPCIKLHVCMRVWLCVYWESSRRKTREHIASRGVSPYLVLWEHLVHFLPSHISNAPQPSQISIAALILTIIPGRDRCKHFISCSLQSAPLSHFLAPSLSHSLSLSVYTLWFLFSVTHQNAQKRLIYTPTHTDPLLYLGSQGWWMPG